jgi:membrane protease YdiL (CAAX protease family)
MNSTPTFTFKYPILSFVLLTYFITWGIWFSLPIFSGSDWTLLKILVGIGMGPGLAALIMDWFHDRQSIVITHEWTIAFIVIFIIITTINLSSLVTGNASNPIKFATATAPGFSLTGVLGSILAALVCAFIFASSLTSRNANLRKIFEFRAPLLWWCLALFIPALFYLFGYLFLWATGQEFSLFIDPDLTVSSWTLYSLRSIAFTLLIVAVGEEVGWRGWMLPRLLKQYNPLKSSIILGVVWGGWHFPLFFNGFYSHSPESIIGYLLIGPIYAILYTWFYIRTGGNLLLVIVLHTMMNSIDLILAPSPAIAFIILFVITLVITNKMWRYRYKT